MKQLSFFPEKGRIFGIYLRDLECPKIEANSCKRLENLLLSHANERENNQFDYAIYSEEMAIPPEKKETVLLLKYLGKGECEEFLSTKRIHIDTLNKDEETVIRGEENWRIQHMFKKRRAFCNYFDMYMQSPFIIQYESRETDFLAIDEEFKVAYAKNFGKEEEIVALLDSLENKARKSMLDDMKKIAGIDATFAYAENAIYDFQKKPGQKVMKRKTVNKTGGKKS